jgi:hypothetical protein
LWDETHNDVLVDNGLFNVILGSLESIPSSVFEGEERYLGIKVGADPELTPRIMLTSVGYAYMAETAVTDGDWTISGNNLHSSVSGNVGIGAVPPTEKLDVAGTVKMTGFEMPTGSSSGYVLTSDGSGAGTWQAAAGEVGGSGTAGYVPKFTSSTVIGNSAIYQSGTDIGIGTTSPDAILDVYGTRNISAISDGIVNIGNTSSKHVTLDNNEIHARNGSSTSDLYINDFGGDVLLAKNGNVGIGTPSPSSKLQVWGSMAVAIKKVYHSTSPYNLTSSDCIISANATSGSIHINLPDASGVIGRIYTVKKVDSSSNWVYIWADSGDTIDGVVFIGLAAQWQYYTIVSDGSNWLSIGHGS